jgi:hypothetical protein
MDRRLKKKSVLATVPCHKMNPEQLFTNLSPHSHELISVVQLYRQAVTAFNKVFLELLIVPLFKQLPACMHQKTGYLPQRSLPLGPTLKYLNVFTEACH